MHSKSIKSIVNTRIGCLTFQEPISLKARMKTVTEDCKETTLLTDMWSEKVRQSRFVKKGREQCRCDHEMKCRGQGDKAALLNVLLDMSPLCLAAQKLMTPLTVAFVTRL